MNRKELIFDIQISCHINRRLTDLNPPILAYMITNYITPLKPLQRGVKGISGVFAKWRCNPAKFFSIFFRVALVLFRLTTLNLFRMFRGLCHNTAPNNEKFYRFGIFYLYKILKPF